MHWGWGGYWVWVGVLFDMAMVDGHEDDEVAWRRMTGVGGRRGSCGLMQVIRMGLADSAASLQLICTSTSCLPDAGNPPAWSALC